MENDIFPRMLAEFKDSIIGELNSKILDNLKKPIEDAIQEIMGKWRNGLIKDDIDAMGKDCNKFTSDSVLELK